MTLFPKQISCRTGGRLRYRSRGRKRSLRRRRYCGCLAHVCIVRMVPANSPIAHRCVELIHQPILRFVAGLLRDSVSDIFPSSGH
jgi:hypothetical protein